MLRLRSVTAYWQLHLFSSSIARRLPYSCTTERFWAAPNNMDRVNTAPRLAELRKLMKENNVSVYSEHILRAN